MTGNRVVVYKGPGEVGVESVDYPKLELPEDVVGLSIDEVSARLRRDHGATLIAVNRDGKSLSHLDSEFRLETGDDLIVVAESLGRLSPLQDSRA